MNKVRIVRIAIAVIFFLGGGGEWKRNNNCDSAKFHFKIIHFK